MYTDVHFSSGTVHTVCVSSQYRHGRRWFQTAVSFSIEKLIVEQCTWRYTAQQRWFHAIATFWQAEPTKTRVQELTRTAILGHGHTKAKIVVAVVGVVVVPFTDDTVLRVIVPTATLFIF